MNPIKAVVVLFDRYFYSEKQSECSDLDLRVKPDWKQLRTRIRTMPTCDICHYAFLLSVMMISMIVSPVHILFKLVVIIGLATIFIVPLTSQFFWSALPILTWVGLFFNMPFIPVWIKPAITVQSLPALETILYGDNLSDILAASPNAFLDLLAWLPYGIIHFAFPFILAALLFVFGPPRCLRAYAFAFGYMNLIGVITQLLFPAAPPWYRLLHNLEPANYSMNGSPGGLGRIDQLFGFDMYTTTFSKTSPIIFGAFPSLHSGSAVMEALFFSYLFPRLSWVACAYVSWLWWSTMYLSHHYFIDLTGGAVLSLTIFTYTKYRHLPMRSLKCWCRWSYTSIDKFDAYSSNPLRGKTSADVVIELDESFSSSSSSTNLNWV
ncbi:hypothetical protein LJB42_001167 [Komagataella kurtzmanii]|nr:hypothetical protein LJB42_001167 [Komagataella kurtzmanii]